MADTVYVFVVFDQSAVRCSSQVIWTNVLRAMASVCVAVRVRPLNKRSVYCHLLCKLSFNRSGQSINVFHVAVSDCYNLMYDDMTQHMNESVGSVSF